MANQFALMNVLIKGSSDSVESALKTLESYDYKLHKLSDSKDAVVKIGLVFNKWYEGFMHAKDVPFASIPEIKFIGLGNGGDDSQCDGSYVFFKDFEETGISECYKFTNSNPQMEEFDAQQDVLDKVLESFMDHAWSFRYENYSCGEFVPYAFGSKKDKALINKWKSDEKKNNKADESKIVIGGQSDKPFSYEHIDGVDPSFYEGIFDGKDYVLRPDENINVEIDGKVFTVVVGINQKVKTLLNKFKKAAVGKEIGRDLYDPCDVASGKYVENGEDQYGNAVYGVADDAKVLANVQIAHRVALFAKIYELLGSEKGAQWVVRTAPKKKNGTLMLKRVTQVASLFCMEDDASMYVLCAVAKKDTELVVEIRQISSVDMEKTYEDVISTSNLFRDNTETKQMDAANNDRIFVLYEGYNDSCSGYELLSEKSLKKLCKAIERAALIDGYQEDWNDDCVNRDFPKNISEVDELVNKEWNHGRYTLKPLVVGSGTNDFLKKVFSFIKEKDDIDREYSEQEITNEAMNYLNKIRKVELDKNGELVIVKTIYD